MISVVGLSHKTAPLAVREPFAFSPQASAELLRSLRLEALLLVTCNRTELYGTARTEELRQALYSAAASPEVPLFVLHGRDAVRHLLSVAAGLDSMILGEPQILGQVKSALALAQEAGTLGAVFDRLGQHAITAGRRVRRETALGRGRPSIPRMAASMAREQLPDLRDGTLLVVGAGKVGGLTARSLGEMGATTVLVTNRTEETAAALAREIGGEAVPFGSLDRWLAGADVVITCTGSPAPLLDVAQMNRIAAAREGRPLVIIDLAVPRDVSPEVRGLPGIRLFDLDDLRARATAGVPPAVVAQAEAIVDEETHSFLHWLAGRQAVPTIRALRRRAEAILEQELAQSGEGDPERMRAFGLRLLNKWLHHPVVRMRDRAGTHGPVYLDVARDLFALDSGEGDE